jgi:Mlc titration factor MtfA (ptsG expression regulator)
VIATAGHPNNPHVPNTGEGHGAHNLVLHETAHGLDLGGGGGSANADFNAARTADAATLGTYESQAGNAGQQETYAESAARYYGGDPNDAASHPNLHRYWDGLRP